MWIINKKDKILYDSDAALDGAGCEFAIDEITSILKAVTSEKQFIDICLQETWSGKKYVWKIIKQKNLDDAVIDVAKWDTQTVLIDANGEFVLLDHHHDGTNKHVIRKLTKSFDEIEMKMEDIEALAIAAEEGKFLDSVTEKLGPTVEDVAMAWEG
ncbi:MAG: hypothetical protein MJZ20_06930 [Bacteroidaceae bacterium]|nr:hypothetical protein [Bacteroidaceae bacterium]